MEILEKIGRTLQAVRDKKPLIHHITNYVTVNDCANITLSIGASPVMADDVTEVAEMVSFASALVLNIGTLQTRTIESMLTAGKAAKAKGIPVIFDPVGAGATKLRTKTAERIICDIAPNVIRGNMSEVKVLLGVEAKIKGVDSVADEQDAVEVVQRLAEQLKCVVAVTGKTDVVAGGGRVYAIDNGHPIMAHVTGTGCMATSLVGSFCSAAADDVEGAVGGIVVMGLAGERAFSSLHGGESVGTFHTRLFDEVYNITAEKILHSGKVTQLK